MALRLDYGLEAPQGELYDLDPMRAAAATALGGTGVSLPATAGTPSALAAPIGAADVYATIERQILQDLERQSTSQGKGKEEAQPSIPWWGYILPGFGEGYAQGQVLRQQREELKLRQEHQKGQEAQAALQRLQLIETLRQRDRQRQMGQEVAGMLGAGKTLEDPAIQQRMLQQALQAGDLEGALKLYGLQQTTQSLNAVNALAPPGLAPPPASPGAAPALVSTGLETSAPGRQGGRSALTPIQRLIVAKARELGLDPVQALAQAHQESGGTFDNSVTGKDGEIGLFQIMPATGAELGYSPAQLRDPLTNITAGLTYLKQRGLARYNPGDPNYTRDVQRWMPRYQAALGMEGGATPQKGPSLLAAPTTPSPSAAGTPSRQPDALQQDIVRLTAQRDDLERYLGQAQQLWQTRLAPEARKQLQERVKDVQSQLSEVNKQRFQAIQQAEPGDLYKGLLRLNGGDLAKTNRDYMDFKIEEARSQQEAGLTIAAQKAAGVETAKETAKQQFKDTQTLLDVNAQTSRQYFDTKTGDPLPQSTRQGVALDRIEKGEVVFLDDQEVKDYRGIKKMVPLMTQIRGQIERVYGPGGIFENLTPQERLLAAAKGLPARYLQSNPELVELERNLRANVDTLRRNLQGQVGTQTEQDATRGLSALPQSGGIPDSQAVAYGMYNALLESVNGMLGVHLGNPAYQQKGLAPLAAPQAPPTPRGGLSQAEETLLEKHKR